MISLLFFVLAAISNSIMDTSKDHYSISRLPKGQWWDGSTSWLNKYINRDASKGVRKVPVQLTDCWHFFKFLMIVFIALAIVSYKPIFSYNGNEVFVWIFNKQTHLTLFGRLLNETLNVCVFGVSWNLIFSLFYNKILINNK